MGGFGGSVRREVVGAQMGVSVVVEDVVGGPAAVLPSLTDPSSLTCGERGSRFPLPRGGGGGRGGSLSGLSPDGTVTLVPVVSCPVVGSWGVGGWRVDGTSRLDRPFTDNVQSVEPTPTCTGRSSAQFGSRTTT